MMRPALTALVAGALLAGCGQTGKLYLPEKPEQAQGEVVTRPTQTPPDTGSADSGKPSNSPQTVDSPAAPDTPTPEVTAPEGSDPAGKKDKKDGATNPPPASPPKN